MTVLKSSPQEDNEALKQKKPKSEKDGMGEEYLKKKQEIDELVNNFQQQIENSELASANLEIITTELRKATLSTVTVSPSLKILRGFVEELESVYKNLSEENVLKKPLADVLSVLFSTFPDPERKVLRYALAGTRKGLVLWGHEYLRNVTAEIVAEYQEQKELLSKQITKEQEITDFNAADFMAVVYDIVVFYMHHRNEIDAIDLLVELQKIDEISQYVDGKSHEKVAQYLLALAQFSASSEDRTALFVVAYTLFMKNERYCQAARVVLKMQDSEKLIAVFNSCKDELERLQLCYLIATQRYNFNESQKLVLSSEEVKVLANENLSKTFLMLAKELEVEEPKIPEDIYKTHLENRRRLVTIDVEKETLAATFVNAFVNVGFGKDKLVTINEASWIHKNKDQGLMAAVASLGIIFLWDIDNGLAQLDKYQWSTDSLIKAGAYMGFGLVSSSIASDMDPALSLLSEHVEAKNVYERIGAILGLSFAYAGCQREMLLEVLVPLTIDTSISLDVSAVSALALGLSFLGTGNQSVIEALTQTLLERQMISGDLDHPLAYLFGLSIGLLFLGLKSESETTLESLKTVDKHPIGCYASACVLGMAYAGTGDVTKIQAFLKLCCMDESKTPFQNTSSEQSSVPNAAPNKSESRRSTTNQDTNRVKNESNETSVPLTNMHQAAAVIAMPLIALTEEIGSEMIFRMIDHILQYGTVVMKRAVPLALALSSASNPRPAVVDILSRLAHETDSDIALNATFALGLVGAGTNNSRIAEILRQLVTHYATTANVLFVIRLAQGLLYMGKGLTTLSPIHSDRFLINYTSLGCFLVVLHTLLFMKQTILGSYSYLMYFLVPAMRPRMLVTVNDQLEPLQVVVRVGQAVDITGQAGNPRSITGFQTHSTPVLLAEGERAELGTTEYNLVTPLPLEGVIILKKCSK